MKEKIKCFKNIFTFNTFNKSVIDKCKKKQDYNMLV